MKTTTALVLLASVCLAFGSQRMGRAVSAASLPDLQVVLAAHNRGVGLEVPSGGDGANVPVAIGGQTGRRVAGPRSSYLYVKIQHPAYTNGPCAVYVSAEVFDEKFARLMLEYDQASAAPNQQSMYTHAPAAMLLTGSGRWRTVTFVVPDLRLGHGQNGGADFRFVGHDVVFHGITVSPRPPAGFDPDQAVDPEALRALKTNRPAGMELTFGNDASRADAQVFKALGVSSVESYVDWAGVEPEPNHWDWRKWDAQVGVLQKEGLRWVPFLIAGPAYATPLWFQQSPQSHVFQCLEHGGKSCVQSIFNPDLRPRITAFIQAFAERYAASNVIESVLLGVTGIYGESIYPAGPEGGWTARLTGKYHNHHGWWAGDPLAAAAFRAAMQRHYGDIVRLNAAWGTHLADFEAVKTFLPDQAPSDRARADFVEWYQQAMTEWAVFWVETTRRFLPKTEIYLCTGGDGMPSLGADFTAQAKAIAPLGAGIRITNEGSDYTQNFRLTREVATATRLYGTFCGFEPASGVTPTGVVARIYNATASGARQLHFYIPNVLGHDPGAALARFSSNISWLAPRRPRPDVALYLPRETWALEPNLRNRCYDLSRQLRDVVDHDFVTRLSVADGALREQHVLVLAAAPVLEPAAAATIEKWVETGGLLVAVTQRGEQPGERLYDNAAWRDRLFVKAASCGDVLLPSGVNRSAVEKLTRHCGQGRTVFLPGMLPDTVAVARVVAALLPGPVDGKLDGRFATRTDDGVLWYEALSGRIWMEQLR